MRSIDLDKRHNPLIQLAEADLDADGKVLLMISELNNPQIIDSVLSSLERPNGEIDDQIEEIFDHILEFGDENLIHRFLPLLLKKNGIVLEQKENNRNPFNIILQLALSAHPDRQKIGLKLIEKMNTNLFEQFNDLELNEWICAAIYNPKICKLLSSIFCNLKILKLDGLRNPQPSNPEPWSNIARNLVRRTKAPNLPEDENNKNWKFLHLHAIKKFNHKPITKKLIREYIVEGWAFERIQGRTILLKHPEKNTFLAIKIIKKNESVEELWKEFATEKYLMEHAGNLTLQLQSNLPHPKNVYHLTDVTRMISEWTEQGEMDTEQRNTFAELANTEAAVAYVYEADKTYFNYLDELDTPKQADLSYDNPNEKQKPNKNVQENFIDEAKFAKANRAIVHDLGILGLQGIVYDRFAPLYHSLHDGTNRRYILLRNLFVNTYGSGCLEAWTNSVRWSNGRESGAADWGDWRSLSEIFFDKKFHELFFKDFAKVNQEIKEGLFDTRNIGHLIKLNFIAEQAYVLMLIAGSRARVLTENAKKNNKSSAEIYKIWQNAATQTIINCAQLMSLYSSIPEDICYRFLSNWIEPTRLARQMQFWMTGEYIPYISDPKKGQRGKPIPEEVYGEGVIVITRKDDNFDSTNGFHIKDKNGNIIPDLGSDNGVEPIKEANKLFYAMVMGIQSVNNHRQLFDNLYHEVRKDKFLTEQDRQNWEKRQTRKEQRRQVLTEQDRQALTNIQSMIPQPRFARTMLRAFDEKTSQHQAAKCELAAYKIQRNYCARQFVRKMGNLFSEAKNTAFVPSEPNMTKPQVHAQKIAFQMEKHRHATESAKKLGLFIKPVHTPSIDPMHRLKKII